MSSRKGVLDLQQTVGYEPAHQALVVTLSAKMANAMKKDGWDVGFDAEIGHFIRIEKG